VPGHEIPQSAFSASTRYTATEQVKIAGCVFAVSSEIFFGALETHLEIEKPSALSASLKTAFAADILRQLFAHTRVLRSLPGNTNATLPIVNPFLAPSRNNRGGRQLLFDFLVHLRAAASPAATRMAFFTALAFERPLAITQTPRTPSSGAPPYSV